MMGEEFSLTVPPHHRPYQKPWLSGPVFALSPTSKIKIYYHHVNVPPDCLADASEPF